MVWLQDRYPTRKAGYAQHPPRHAAFFLEAANDIPLLSPRGASSGKGLVAACAVSICLWGLIGFALQRLFAG